METMQLQELVDEVVNSTEIGGSYHVDIQIATDLMAINGKAKQLSRALLLLMDNSRNTRYGGGFLSLKARNYEITPKSRSVTPLPCGNYVKLTICHVEMENMTVARKQDSIDEIERYTNVREAHKIIEAHAGYLKVESFREKGCSFQVFLPVSLRPKRSRQRKTVTASILVVDDNAVQRAVIGRILRRLGYAVRTCSRGKEAVAYVEGHPQDLLVLDMMIGDITGTETYSRVLQFEPGQKAIIVSGSSPEELVDEALRLGAGAFLAKPVLASELADAVKKELDRGDESES